MGWALVTGDISGPKRPHTPSIEPRDRYPTYRMLTKVPVCGTFAIVESNSTQKYVQVQLVGYYSNATRTALTK